MPGKVGNPYHDAKGLFTSGPGGGLPDLKEVVSSGLTEEQRNQLTEYASTEYTMVNKYLRGQSSAAMKDIVEPRVARIDSAMKNASLKRSIEVYRSEKSDRLDKFKDGDLITEKAYLSTTADRKVAENLNVTGKRGQQSPNRVMRIVVPAGAKAIPLKSLSKHPEEQELLIDRGSTFRVRGTGKDRYLEMVQP